jgi:DNA-binding LacI/PurR family transcriptional regulator
VKVPERLALAGFDSIDLHQVDSSIVDVRSILVAEQDGEAMGRQAATRLKELIEKKLTSPETRLEVFLPPKRLGSKLV